MHSTTDRRIRHPRRKLPIPRRVSPEGSALERAVKYKQNHWRGLTRFVDHPEVWLDNNATERVLRTPILGRKNHYDSKSERGIKAAAILYSVIEICLLVGVNPRDYLREAVHRANRRPPVPGGRSLFWLLTVARHPGCSRVVSAAALDINDTEPVVTSEQRLGQSRDCTGLKHPFVRRASGPRPSLGAGQLSPPVSFFIALVAHSSYFGPSTRRDDGLFSPAASISEMRLRKGDRLARPQVASPCLPCAG